MQRQEEYEGFVKPALAAGEEKHGENLNGLYRNLGPEAMEHLSAILERRKKILSPAVASYRDLYSDAEYEQFKEVERFGQQITQWGDYFQYKHFKLPLRSFGAETFLYRHGLDRLKTAKNIGSKAIIDVGGFIADSVLVFRDAFPEQPVYSFEPNNLNYALACKTLEINNLSVSGGEPLIVMENIALGEAAGVGKISAAAGGGARLLEKGKKDGQGVSIDTLDHYVAEHAIRVGLIKVDVEGHEQSFLRGALETLKTWKPVLLVSIYHSYDDFFRIKPFLEDLDLGYSFDFFKGIDGRISTETMLLCEVR